MTLLRVCEFDGGYLRHRSALQSTRKRNESGEYICIFWKRKMCSGHYLGKCVRCQAFQVTSESQASRIVMSCVSGVSANAR